MVQYVDMLNKLDAKQLLSMHEYMPSIPCGVCSGTGLNVKVVQVFDFIAIAGTDDPCECCSGLGYHFMLSAT